MTRAQAHRAAREAQPQLSLIADVEITDAEVEVWRKRDKLLPSQWAAKHRMLTDGPLKGSLWSNELTPYLVKPMDTWAKRGVREDVVVGVNQSGKTQIITNCWASAQDQTPTTSLINMADKETAHHVSRDRLQPMVEASPRLARLRTDRAEDLGLDRIALQGSITYLSWATSAARLQTMPIEHAYGDEVALYKNWTAKAAVTDPVSMLRGRITTFRYTGKLLLVSSIYSDADPQWRAFLACQEKWAYAIRCPHCGQLQIPGDHGLRWDASITDPGRLQSENLAWYECEHCQAPLSDGDLRLATAAGDYLCVAWDPDARWWLPAEPAKDPVRVGFWFNAFVSPFIPLGEIAAQALRAKDDPQEDHDYHHRYLALPYRDERAPLEEDSILILCDHRDRDQLPGQAVALTAGVDVQERMLYYAIRAWAPGPDEESWLVRAGAVPSFGALSVVMFDVIYRDFGGERMVIDFGLVDARYRRDEVLAWCNAHPPFRPSMGWERLRQLVRLAKSDDKYPGLLRHDVNATAWKNALRRKWEIAPADPGAWHLHTNLDQHGNALLLVDYARQLCSEKPDERGLWRQINNRPNHYFDCEVLNLVCAFMLEIRNLDPDPAPAPPPAAPTPERRARW